jgi:hypothetical protein
MITSYLAMPVLFMTEKDLNSFDEYSWSLPTNPSVGRIWKRWTPAGWIIGRCEPVPFNGKQKSFGWYRPVLMPAGARIACHSGIWIAKCGAFYVSSRDVEWVLREIWRPYGAPKGEC